MEDQVDHEEVVDQNNENDDPNEDEDPNEDQVLSKVQVEEKLISFVYSNPHLYTKQSKAYHDGQLIQNSWQEFAHQINSNVTFVKNLWTALKNQHNAHLKKLHSALTTGAGRNAEDDAPIRLPTFRHSKAMEFMKDNYVPRKKRTTTFTLNKNPPPKKPTPHAQSSTESPGFTQSFSETGTFESNSGGGTDGFLDDGSTSGQFTPTSNSTRKSSATISSQEASQTPGAALLAKEEYDRRRKRTNKRMESLEPNEFESQLLETLGTLTQPPVVDKPNEPDLFASSLVPSFKRICEWDPLRFSELKLDIMRHVIQAERDAKNAEYLARD